MVYCITKLKIFFRYFRQNGWASINCMPFNTIIQKAATLFYHLFCASSLSGCNQGQCSKRLQYLSWAILIKVSDANTAQIVFHRNGTVKGVAKQLSHEALHFTSSPTLCPNCTGTQALHSMSECCLNRFSAGSEHPTSNFIRRLHAVRTRCMAAFCIKVIG